jgi:hypothetical protein
VIGGDATPPAGRYAAAIELLEELAAIGHPFARIGIGAPRGSPADRRRAAARALPPAHATTSSPDLLHAVALAGWIRCARGRIDLP